MEALINLAMPNRGRAGTRTGWDGEADAGADAGADAKADAKADNPRIQSTIL